MTTTGRQPDTSTTPGWTRRPASLAAAVTAELVQRIVRDAEEIITGRLAALVTRAPVAAQ